MARIIHPHIYASIRSIALKVSLRRLEAYQHSIYHEGLVSSLIFSLKHSIETSIALIAILVDSQGRNPPFQRRPGDPQVRRCARRPEYSLTSLSKGRLDHAFLLRPPCTRFADVLGLHGHRVPRKPALFPSGWGKPMSSLVKSGFSSLACNTSPCAPYIFFIRFKRLCALDSASQSLNQI